MTYTLSALSPTKFYIEVAVYWSMLNDAAYLRHKPHEGPSCGARCKTIQGLRGHERFRHGINARPDRRWDVYHGEVIPLGGPGGLTFNEAMEEVRWDLLKPVFPR